MTQLENDIQVLEVQLATIQDLIIQMGSNSVLTQQRDSIKNKLKEKRQQLAAQKAVSTFGPVSIYDYMKINTPYSSSLQDCIEKTIDHLTNPADPNEDTSIPGLLLGRIQSGKTRAFIGVIALAFDKGFDACIVLTKPDDGLVAQTKARLEDEFKHFLDDTIPYPQNVICVHDVNQKTSLTHGQLQCKNIFVLHKNSRLDIMKRILDQSFATKKILIIDDEADFVSRTFYSKRQQITGGVTGFRIDELTSNPQIECYYLQVTATPYSLLLQPNEVIDVNNGTMSCFRPRFTVLVPTHDLYIGGKEYFDMAKTPSSMYSLLFHPISDACFDYMLKKNADRRVTGHPQTHSVFVDLRMAIATYFVASAIRQIQEQRKTNRVYKTSMLIHCAIEKGDHTHEQTIVNKILSYWQLNITQGNWGGLPEFASAYTDLCQSIQLGKTSNILANSTYIPSQQEIQNKLINIFSQTEYTVKCVNGDTTDDPNMYTKTGQLRLTDLLNIFIGGYKADRGITIDHMIAFAYGRRPKNGGSANTILQHMRQYGNRSKEDMSVTRFHTTVALHQRLEDIYYTDEALRKFFEKNAAPKTVSMEWDPQAGYRLCSPAQVRMSDMYGLGAFGRLIATGGMQTKKGIANDIQNITNQLKSIDPKEKKPFKINKNKAIEWIRKIRETFEYNNGRLGNLGIEWDEEIMIAAIDKFCPQDNEIWCYYKLGMGIARQYAGRFSDAPEDGQTDTPIAQKTATDRPFLMLIGEKGDKAQGWNGQPFFWPVLRLPHNASNIIFCHGTIGAPRTNSRIQVTLNDGSNLPDMSILDTMVECIKLANPAKVEALGIKYRKNNLIFQAGKCPKNYKVIEPRKYYIRTGIPAQLAKRFVDEISSQLTLGWSVQII